MTPFAAVECDEEGSAREELGGGDLFADGVGEGEWWQCVALRTSHVNKAPGGDLDAGIPKACYAYLLDRRSTVERLLVIVDGR